MGAVMGFSYNVQVLRGDGTVIGFSSAIKQKDYGAMAIVTGIDHRHLDSMGGWSQLVSTRVAATFLRQFGERDHANEFEAEYEGELVRITIA